MRTQRLQDLFAEFSQQRDDFSRWVIWQPVGVARELAEFKVLAQFHSGRLTRCYGPEEYCKRHLAFYPVPPVQERPRPKPPAKSQLKRQAMEILLSGETTREAERRTGLARQTIITIRKTIASKIPRCSCGARGGHPGRCGPRRLRARVSNGLILAS